MSPVVVRRTVIAVCVAGIAGMIATQVAGNDGAAITFGLITAAAVGALMLVTAVTTGPVVSPAEAEVLGARVEERVTGLVAAGADEIEVRGLVRDAVRLGRASGSP